MATWDAIGEALREDFSDLPDLTRMVQLVLRLTLAALLGAMLGWDRERTGKAAGLRTHMLVAVGSAFFVLVAQQAGMTSADLSRVIQGLVTGIGFIGGGAILKLGAQQRVKGLTTAADIWLTAGVGIAAGLGREVSAIFATGLALVIICLLRPVERWLDRARSGSSHDPSVSRAPRASADKRSPGAGG